MDLETLIAQLGGAGWSMAAFILAISVIVAVHEYGHYIVARWCGIRSEIFSLGFGPVVMSKRDKRGTLWQIALFPLGGFVKFAGDHTVASTTITSDDDNPAARDTLRGAPLWARVVTVSAGPAFNFMLAIVLFSGVFMYRGYVVEPLTISTVYTLPQQAEFDLKPGDIIEKIEGKTIANLGDFYDYINGDLPVKPILQYQVIRSGRSMGVSGPYPMPGIVKSVHSSTAASDAGLKRADVITAVDGVPIIAFSDLHDKVSVRPVAPVVLSVWRDGYTLDITVRARRVDIPNRDGGFEARYLIGISGGMAYDFSTRYAPLSASLYSGVAQTWFVITSSLSGVWHILSGSISSCNISGPVGIAQASGDMAAMGTISFVGFIAILSAAIGLFNLLPVPVLDGGHLVFYAYEAIARRPLPARFLYYLYAIGFAVLMMVMAFAILNDVFLC